MIKRVSSTCLMLSMASLAHAGLPLSLSSPSPAIDGVLYAGNGSSSYTYTIYNRTNRNIFVSQSITGNSTSIAVTTPCTVVPAAGSCNFVVSAQPSVQDYLLAGGIQDNVIVSYSGRLPSQLSVPIATRIAIPVVSDLHIISSVASAANSTLAGGYVTYVATAQTAAGVILDLTPVVTWSSSDPTVASAPNTQGQAFTYPPAGGSPSTGARTTTITASYSNGGTPLSATSYLDVYHDFYVATPAVASPMLSTSFDANQTPITPLNTLKTYSKITGLAINSDARYLYMSNQSNQVYSCPLTATSGQFGAPETCSQIILATGTGTADTTIKISPNNKFFYSLTPNGVYACQMAQATGSISGCVLQSAISGAYGTLSAFAIDPTGLYMYVIAKANKTPYLQTCTINQTTGGITGCVTQGSSTGIKSIYTTSGITAVSTVNGTYLYGSAYIPGGPADGAVLSCKVSASGSVSNCTYSNVSGITNNPVDVSVSQTSSGALELYVSQNLTVYNCPINSSDYQSFGTCYSVTTSRSNAGVLVR